MISSVSPTDPACAALEPMLRVTVSVSVATDWTYIASPAGIERSTSPLRMRTPWPAVRMIAVAVLM